MVLDIIECLVQRDVGVTSKCIQGVYKHLREAILMRDDADPKREAWKHKKIVVIAHSQGGLILSLALDMLYADLSDEVLSRLEV